MIYGSNAHLNSAFSDASTHENVLQQQETEREEKNVRLLAFVGQTQQGAPVPQEKQFLPIVFTSH